ncbi:related to COX23 Protein that functions in mitochondrial copper homeostasis and is essential for functional cytochrome oxidase expression [Ramularia collo-cygni]|uniref:Related to COX23 Protein that functions in mitochondrial copper homeostasis and is essential for functional cytochrome oxidase expression n=1 Tax=Ramularia collo-cygni TaxID=112498 RepID=A0A2D3V6K7_9PEZI|nr:related to COX23 Protein that functions in mitochondrial copper homeostasis and is essential for functional cytochrome oxidase expression [Ramularia collo-cygni]CZT18164.1 related to COX23 Protein that functions in mitochondrial copper homeostasis and is essential for functional cytochrome oxidase expression [Ramularia collo-cygni]
MSEEKPETEEKTTWNKSSARFNNKQYSEYFDPCQDAANRSLKCMRRNGGDRAMCHDYFHAYKACKKSWMDEMKEQKRKEAKSWFS